jgi:hypothetical protein
MTTTVNETKVITLLDGSTVNARPLKLSLLRDFMNTFAKIADVSEDNDKSLDLLIQCVQIAFKQFAPDLAAKDAKDLEDVLDIKLVYQIVEEASGIKVGDGLF